jgi:hypothetical protein
MGLYNPRDTGSTSSASSSGLPMVGKTTFYQRPSFGLKIWGPLVPAADNLTALYSLTAFQTLIGITMFRTVRLRWKDTSFWGRLTKVANVTAGTYVLFNSGLEASRLLLPYDPWYDEAKRAREDAVAQGKKPNWWFGPFDMKPMGLAEWNSKMDKWIMDQEENLDRQSVSLVGSPEIKAGYLKIKELNTFRQSQILQQLNNGSFNDILPNYQPDGPIENDKQTCVIPAEMELESDLDLLEVWHMNDPWESLADDTNIMVRLIPSSLRTPGGENAGDINTQL